MRPSIAVRYALALALAVALAEGAPPAHAGGKRYDALLQIVTPTDKGTAPAHPHVNLVVLFGQTSDGVQADPSTFQARLNGQDVTSLFLPLAPGELGGADGRRAEIPPDQLRIGRRNKLKVAVRSLPFPKGKHTKTAKDKDRVRFTPEEAANQPPVAVAAADSDLIFAGLPIQFDGDGSADPELDALTYSWDFGDGAGASEPDPQHSYGTLEGDVTATLTVSDGGASATDTVALLAQPPLDPDRTKGLLQVTAAGPLELGGVPVGGSGERVITVTNTDFIPTSQLKVRAEAAGDGFSLDPTELDLGAGESGELTVRFAPTAAGHAHATVSLVASASNRAAVSMLAHGYGGAVPEGSTGPTLAARTAFYTDFSTELRGLAIDGIRPDGTRFWADNAVHTCVVPGNGSGTGDACITNADCAANGGTCSTSSTCPSGDNVGQQCTLPADCPGSICPSYMLLEPEDLCSDAAGNYYILSDEGTYTDPNFNALTEKAATLLRVTLDGSDQAVDKRILDRPNEETVDMACDGISPAASGRVFIAEYFNVDDNICFRTEKNELNAINKSNGGLQTLLPRLDAVEGIDACNDIEDETDGLAASRDGKTIFASFFVGGIWRVKPSPLAFLTNTPDSSILDVHPDGALLYATATDAGTVGRINLYKVSAARVATGPLPVASLTPCATITVPNNGGRTFVTSLAAEGSASHPTDGIALVSFATSTSGLTGILGPELRVHGVAAFTAPSDPSDSCVTSGIITLDSLDQLSF